MSEVHLPEHASPIKNVRQLLVIVVLAFVIPIALCVTIAQLVMRGSNVAGTPAMSDAEVAKRLQPVGTVALSEAKGAKAERTGKEIFDATCAACHVAGVLNAPKVGDNAAWAKLIAQGQDATVANAIKGIRQMPPRGGNADLSDTEVARAVAHMASQSGASWKEPEMKPVATAAAERTGEQIVQAQCIKCHQTGEGGAPKIGDRAAWIPRVKKGLDPVIRAAIGGHDNMPARGGRADLTDPEFRSAVVYMFQAGGAVPAPAPAATPAAAPQPAAADGAKGKAVYDASCSVCHAAGVAGAPKAGDKAAWAPRLAGGIDTLYASSLKGKNAMPPKGGNVALADAEVKAAVDYMVGLVK